MSKDRIPERVGLGLRAVKGGSVVVGIKLDTGQPRILLSSFLTTAVEGDRLTLEPYHVAAEMGRAADGSASVEARQVVAEGRKRQAVQATLGLEEIVQRLQSVGAAPTIAALLVNRANWITDLLEYSLAFADHPPVAEGLAVRDALRSALGRIGLDVAEMDEKSLVDSSSIALGLRPTEIEARLKELGTTVGKPWRKEQKLACLAAWAALAAAG